MPENPKAESPSTHITLLPGAKTLHHSAAAIAKPGPTPIVPNVPAGKEKFVFLTSQQNVYLQITNSKLLLMSDVFFSALI
jgi:hypothetical protein